MLIANTITSQHQADLNPPPVGSNSFIFKIERECTTSAGVFSKEKRLIKTLWSGKRYEAGTYTEQWDGINDEGDLALAGNYDVTILSNNMVYEWEGVIGNTSKQATGEHVYHNFFRMYSMVIHGNSAYYAVGYNEKGSSQQKFNIHSPKEY